MESDLYEFASSANKLVNAVFLFFVFGLLIGSIVINWWDES